MSEDCDDCRGGALDRCQQCGGTGEAPDHEAAARQIMERGADFATQVLQKLLADLGGHQVGWMLALPLPSPSTPAGLLEQLTRSLVLIESRAAGGPGGPGEAKRALELLPADYVASIRRALVEEPRRPDLFDALDEVSADLQSDGVGSEPR